MHTNSLPSRAFDHQNGALLFADEDVGKAADCDGADHDDADAYGAELKLKEFGLLLCLDDSLRRVLQIHL